MLPEQHAEHCTSVSYCGLQDEGYPDRQGMGYPFNRLFPDGILSSAANHEQLGVEDDQDPKTKRLDENFWPEDEDANEFASALRTRRRDDTKTIEHRPENTWRLIRLRYKQSMGWVMRYAVLGVGGVGGLVGGALTKAGHDVTLLVRPGRREHYSEHLSVQSELLGNFEAPVRVADGLDEQCDVVWITVKAMALEAALSTNPPEVLGDALLVPLLNGVDHVGRLRDGYGAERVLPGTIRVEADQAGPGRVKHHSAFADVQVAPNPATQERAQTLCEELRDAGMGCEVQDDETTMLWSKLCFLAPFALATTASEVSLGGVRENPGRWVSLERCVSEACAVGAAEGAMVAPEPILTALEGLPNGFRSSMQKDVAAGKVPELDAIAGPILRGGSEHGIEVSAATRSLVERVLALE